MLSSIPCGQTVARRMKFCCYVLESLSPNCCKVNGFICCMCWNLRRQTVGSERILLLRVLESSSPSCWRRTDFIVACVGIFVAKLLEANGLYCCVCWNLRRQTVGGERTLLLRVFESSLPNCWRQTDFIVACVRIFVAKLLEANGFYCCMFSNLRYQTVVFWLVNTSSSNNKTNLDM